LKSPEFSVVIIGGGFSGSALAIQLLRRVPDLRLAIIDKHSTLGRGLAYASKYRCHLLNVPAGNMSALPDDAEHFLRWAREHHEASTQGRSFLSRSLFGRYVGSLLEETVAEAGGAQFQRIQDEVLSVRQERSLFRIFLRRGHDLTTQAVVLAIGNFPPANLKIHGLSDVSKHYVPFAWSPDALKGIPRDGEVLLVGSGLTSLDLAVGLKSEGFAGRIHILSRRGLLPQRYQQTGPWAQYWNEQSPRTIRGLLSLVRQEVKRAADAGVDWRAVIDVLRPVTAEVWQSLPPVERKRFLRHVRSYWEAHRHRVAPEIGDLVADLMHDRQLRVYAGRLTNYRERRDFAEITFQDRLSGKQRRLQVHRVINCTGSETDCRRIDDPLIMSLFAQGLARPDPLFLGLDVNEAGALLDVNGDASTSLYAVGPTRKGQLWETTAVPELRQQAARLAEVLQQSLLNQVSRPRTQALRAAHSVPLNSKAESARY
jgi:uncharacterized NAD(P)/FAD-binding protein YdhS